MAWRPAVEYKKATASHERTRTEQTKKGKEWRGNYEPETIDKQNITEGKAQ